MDRIALAAKGQERPLLEEVSRRLIEQREDLYVLRGTENPLWAQNIWLNPKVYKFRSISEAGKHLRAIQRNWHLHSVAAHRRAKLISEQLPPMKSKPLQFPALLPSAPLGSFTLFDEETLVYSSACSSAFADGEITFAEDKTGPPSRAYLKLWELFTRLQKQPGAGARVVDLGSSPGGWTWVLDQLGCEVISVDKAPLAAGLKLSERVRFMEESAFALAPTAIGDVDWLFSDVICYPERLLELVEAWISAGKAKNFVCTLKFQGPVNFDVVAQFLKIANSQILHLFNNKHELTWIRLS